MKGAAQCRAERNLHKLPERPGPVYASPLCPTILGVLRQDAGRDSIPIRGRVYRLKAGLREVDHIGYRVMSSSFAWESQQLGGALYIYIIAPRYCSPSYKQPPQQRLVNLMIFPRPSIEVVTLIAIRPKCSPLERTHLPNNKTRITRICLRRGPTTNIDRVGKPALSEATRRSELGQKWSTLENRSLV